MTLPFKFALRCVPLLTAAFAMILEERFGVALSTARWVAIASIYPIAEVVVEFFISRTQSARERWLTDARVAFDRIQNELSNFRRIQDDPNSVEQLAADARRATSETSFERTEIELEPLLKYFRSYWLTSRILREVKRNRNRAIPEMRLKAMIRSLEHLQRTLDRIVSPQAPRQFLLRVESILARAAGLAVACYQGISRLLNSLGGGLLRSALTVPRRLWRASASLILAWSAPVFLASFLAFCPHYLNWVAVFIICATLMKCLALFGGIRWVLSGEKLDDIDDISNYDEVVKAFASSKVIVRPFGLSDASLRLQIIKLRGVNVWLSEFAVWLRNTLFGFNSLAMLSAITLTLWPLQHGQLDGGETALQFFIVVLLAMTALMGLEVLVGQTILRDKYSLLMHFAACKRNDLIHRDNKQFLLLFEMSQTLKYAVYSVVCGAAVFWSGFNLWGGFEGVSSSCSPIRADIRSCGEGFLEFLYFALTTFTTVGFGDIAPTALWSRGTVCYFELLGLGYILFLVNIVVGGSGNEVSDGNDQIGQ